MLKLSRRSGETLVIQTETEKITIYFNNREWSRQAGHQSAEVGQNLAW